MQKRNQKQNADHPDQTDAVPDSVAAFIAVPQLGGAHGPAPDATGFDLIDQAAELIRASEQRAAQAHEKAEKVSARAIEAVKVAQLRIAQTQAHARMVAQQAAEQAKLAEERIAASEALAQERVDKAEAWAQEAEERARSAETRLETALARAADAEERLDHYNQVLRRKVLPASAPHSQTAPSLPRSLN